MPIRQARGSDLPRMAEVLAASFHEEELNARMFPYRNEYPGDYLGAWRRRVWEHWWNYSRVWMVSYEVEEDGSMDESENALPRANAGWGKRKGKEIMTGVAEWERAGLGWERLWGIGGWWDPRRLMRPLIQFANKLHNWIIRDRAAARPSPSDPTPITMNNFEQAMYPFIAHHFCDPPYRRNHWSLCTLGVDPQYQNRGAGRELVAWGLGRARAEELPAVVIGAKGKDVFYRRCGFDLLVGWATEGVDANGKRNPLGERGIGGGCIMFTRVKEDDDRLEERQSAGHSLSQ